MPHLIMGTRTGKAYSLCFSRCALVSRPGLLSFSSRRVVNRTIGWSPPQCRHACLYIPATRVATRRHLPWFQAKQHWSVARHLEP